MCDCAKHHDDTAACTCICEEHGNFQLAQHLALSRYDEILRIKGMLENRIPLGTGDASDVDAGRCCPHCRHLLTDHNRAVWEGGYGVGTRHALNDAENAVRRWRDAMTRPRGLLERILFPSYLLVLDRVLEEIRALNGDGDA